MDIFTGDDFPDHVAPFPDTTDFLYTHSTALIHSPETITQRPNLPPQKLRPIRCSGKSPGNSQANELPENGVTFESLEKCENVASLDVGFHSNQLCSFNSESSKYFDSLEKQVEVKEVSRKNVGRHIAENGCLGMEGPEGSGSGAAADIWDPNVEEQPSLSSDDDNDLSANTKEPSKKKRRKKLESFLQSLVMKVMEKQEQMHKQLIEMIERKEKESMLRKQTWKQTEMERIKKDEKVRELEKSRNLTLMSFIQSLSSLESQVPKLVGTACMEENECEVGIQKDCMSDPCNSRWPEAELEALIALRTALEHKFRLMGSKGSIWEEVSDAMHNMGYNRTAKKCKEKWENINKYYKRTMGSGKKRRLNSKTCSYFNELDILYNNGLLNPGNVFSNTDTFLEIKKE
ncbi:Trihelix transcription factor GT-2 [Quillaja saponaria]|uniref:Trihelix transcription factor GT-2 n=1 Tax=Quillaja saponaria TaxID=32244 RepID=A0AAD7KWY6_QUISA|nr:Trihelix transcription factor GT-2 [Quillaja saponaria]